MVLATFENVLVTVEGMPEGTTVVLGVAEEGLVVDGFGMLAWKGARVGVDDLSPRGIRVRMGPTSGAPSTFFLTVLSIPEGLSLPVVAASIERLAAHGGARVDRALTAA